MAEEPTVSRVPDEQRGPTSPLTRSSDQWGTKDASVLDSFDLIRQMMKQIPYSVVLAGVTGAHQFGLANDDSDIDVRGIYLKPTHEILALHPGRDTIENIGAIDIQFYELEKSLHMMLSHNGNIVQLLLSPTVFYLSDTGVRLREIAQKYLTKKLVRYYVGYATSQRKRAAQNRGGKALVYTYYEAFSGIHLVREGRLEYNFYRLRDYMTDLFHSALLDAVFVRPKWQVVDALEMQRFEEEWDQLVTLLYAEADKSSLPATYDGYDELNALLLDVRQHGDRVQGREWGVV